MPSSDPLARWDCWEAIWKHEDGTCKPRPIILVSSPSRVILEGSCYVWKWSSKQRDGRALQVDAGSPEAIALGLKKTCWLYPNLQRQLSTSLLIKRRGSPLSNTLAQFESILAVRPLPILPRR